MGIELSTSINLFSLRCDFALSGLGFNIWVKKHQLSMLVLCCLRVTKVLEEAQATTSGIQRNTEFYLY